MQSKHYEFRYQSWRQKAVLWVLKLVVGTYTVWLLYSLGWVEDPTSQKLRTLGAALIGIWIYTTLSSVKAEIQELFVQPVNWRASSEVMFLGVVCYFSGLMIGFF